MLNLSIRVFPGKNPRKRTIKKFLCNVIAIPIVIGRSLPAGRPAISKIWVTKQQITSLGRPAAGVFVMTVYSSNFFPVTTSEKGQSKSSSLWSKGGGPDVTVRVGGFVFKPACGRQASPW